MPAEPPNSSRSAPGCSSCCRRKSATRWSSSPYPGPQTRSRSSERGASGVGERRDRHPLPLARLEVGDERCDRRLLWRFGISGDRPIILVRVNGVQNLGLLRSLAQALRLWTWGGLACDLVVVSAEPASYQMSLHRDIATLRERYEANISPLSTAAGPINTGFHVLRVDELGSAETSTLSRLSSLVFHADGRPLQQHLREWLAEHEQERAHRSQVKVAALDRKSVV